MPARTKAQGLKGRNSQASFYAVRGMLMARAPFRVREKIISLPGDSRHKWQAGPGRSVANDPELTSAWADVLKVISRSAFDLQPVLNTLVESARELCNASQGSFYLREGNLFHVATEVGSPPAFVQFLRDNPFSPDRSTGTGRAAASGKVEHLPDVLADPDYRLSEREFARGSPSTESPPSRARPPGPSRVELAGLPDI
jgi:hypothetical protein